MRRFIRALGPVLAWMGFVFVMSTDLGATSHTSRFLTPCLLWLNPSISAQSIETVNMVVRKAGHVTEYAILAALLLRALQLLRPSGNWSWSLAVCALGAAAAYGATDEIHQLFVQTRGPSVHDVLIDTAGALVGVLLSFWWHRDGRHAWGGVRPASADRDAPSGPS